MNPPRLTFLAPLGILTHLGHAVASLASPEPTTTTVYVGRQFEVRADGQPVKYVFNGDARVARVTGSLSGRERIQRLRLRPGWNLCSLAVDDGVMPYHPSIERAYRWDQAENLYAPVDPEESLSTGTSLWIHATTQVVLSIKGTRPGSEPSTIPAGGVLAGNASFESIPLTLPEGVTIWKFDAASQRWLAGLAGDLADIRELPPNLAPGEAIFVHTTEPVQLPATDVAKQVAYYHQDHLGSSSVVTDATGSLIHETSYHPFGSTRHDESVTALDAHYGFTQKERDVESRLHYFEARYLGAGIARFASADPKFIHPDMLESADRISFLENPQKANPYAYVLNQPLVRTDPFGLDVARPPAGPAPTPETPGPAGLSRRASVSLELRKSWNDEPLIISIVSARNSDMPGLDLQRKWREVPDFRVTRFADGSSPQLARAADLGKPFASATIVVRTQGQGSNQRMEIKLSHVYLTLTAAGDVGFEPMEIYGLNACRMTTRWVGTGSDGKEVERYSDPVANLDCPRDGPARPLPSDWPPTYDQIKNYPGPYK